MGGKWDSAAKGAALLTFSSLFSQTVGFFYRIALSRLIGAQWMGLYQLILPMYSVFTALTASGLTVAASTLSAKYGASGDLGAVRQVRRSCLSVFAALLLPLALVVGVLSDPISVCLLGDARTRLGLLLLIPCVALTGVENLQKHAFFGLGKPAPPALAEMAEQLVRAAAVLGLLLVFRPGSGENTVGLIVLGMGLCEVCSALTLTLLFRRYVGFRPLTALPAGPLRQEIWSIALPVGGTAVLSNLMGSLSAILIPQRLVAGGMDPASAVSALGVVNGMTLPMLYMPFAFVGAMSTLLAPRLAKTTALGRAADTRAQLAQVTAWTSTLLFPAMALLCAVGPTLGQLLYREPRAGEHILPLAAGVILTGFQGVFGSALNGVGCQRRAAANMLMSNALQLAFTYFLVGDPRIGLRGYVTGLWVSALLGAALNWRDIRRSTGLRWELFQWLVAPGLGALLAGLTCRLLFLRLLELGLAPGWDCLITALFGLVLYLAALQAQGVLPRQRRGR